MYTVLFADDEAPVLETLKTTIHWQQFGVGCLLTAMNGQQALEIMKEQHVDLLITDIRMPKMDGLELIKRIRTLYPATHCILLTAHGEFEYARQALLLGVENYILKPFKKDELEETIEKALDNLYASQTNTDSLFENNILLRWLHGSISSAELSERSALLDINIFLPEYRVICIKKKQNRGHLQPYCTTMAEILSKEYETHMLWDRKGHHTFIIGGSTLAPQHLIDAFVIKAAEMNVSELIALSVGSMVSDCNDLPQSYLSACRLVDAVDLSRDGLIVLTVDSPASPEEDALLNDILSLFRCQNDEERRGGYLVLAGKLNPACTVDYNETFAKLSRSILRLFIQEFPSKHDVRDQMHNYINLYTNIETSEAFRTAVLDLMENSFLLFQYSFNQLSPIIQQAISYIHKHYMQSASIKEFCQKAKITTPYLGYLFKKETGFFFNNYLSQYRVCCSIELLRETDKKINDIAKNVGFTSPSYYIACFKQQTGLSPTKYRLLLANKSNE